MAALPLTVRKNIRDNEPKIKEAIGKIEAALKITGVTVDINHAEVYAALPEDKKETVYAIAEVYILGWIDNMVYYKHFDDAMNVDAIKKTWTTKKMTFRINPDANPPSGVYVQCLFENGVLVIQTKPDCYYCNISDCGATLPEGLSNGEAFPLEFQKNMRDNEPTKKEALAKIDAALGVTGFALEIVDVPAVHKAAIERGYENRLGDAIFGPDGYLPTLASKIESLVKDDMVKEAIVEAASAKKVLFRIHPDAEGSVHTLFEKGAIVIQIRADCFWCNIYECGDDLEKRL